MERKIPALAKHLKDLRCEMSIIATDWFLCLFSISLPSEVVARIWDTLFNEGPKILFRVAVAILRILQGRLMILDDAGEVLGASKLGLRQMHDRDGLMKLAFEGIGSLSMMTIQELRQIKQKDVDLLMQQRNAMMDISSARLKLKKAQEEAKSRWLMRDHEEESVDWSVHSSAISGVSLEMADFPMNNGQYDGS